MTEMNHTMNDSFDQLARVLKIANISNEAIGILKERHGISTFSELVAVRPDVDNLGLEDVNINDQKNLRMIYAWLDCYKVAHLGCEPDFTIEFTETSFQSVKEAVNHEMAVLEEGHWDASKIIRSLAKNYFPKPPSPGEWEEQEHQIANIAIECHNVQQPEYKRELLAAGLTEQEAANSIERRLQYLEQRLESVRERRKLLYSIADREQEHGKGLVADYLKRNKITVPTSVRNAIANQKQELQRATYRMKLRSYNKHYKTVLNSWDDYDTVRQAEIGHNDARLWEMEIPADTEINTAMEKTSSEVKYVLGVLGFTTRQFVIFTNVLKCRTFPSLFYVDQDWFKGMQLGLQDGVWLKLRDFGVWYECFLEAHVREPEIVEKDFNTNVWNGFIWGIGRSGNYGGNCNLSVAGSELNLIERGKEQYRYELQHVMIPIVDSFAFRQVVREETGTFYLYQFNE